MANRGELAAQLVQPLQGCFAGRLGQQHRELLPPVPADEIGLAQTLAQEASQARQHSIARRVAQPVVDLLEMVDIDHRHGQGVPVAPCAGDLHVELFHQARVVRESREAILRQPLVIAMLAVPILIQVLFNAGLAYWLNRAVGESHSVACPSALIGASNFFELAVAAAISLFGFNSGAALATVVGVLIEVPVMLLVVRWVNASRTWYERG